MKLKYTPEAISDIQEIQRYIKNTFHNPAAAKRISKMILSACSSLKAFPESGVSIESKTGFQTDLRMLICEKWIAVYRIEGSSDMVSVSRVIDGRQDYMRILFGEMDFAPEVVESELEEKEAEEQQAGPVMTM